MLEQKLTIVPVKLNYDEKSMSSSSEMPSSKPLFTIKTASAELAFFNGIDERVIQTVIRELKYL